MTIHIKLLVFASPTFFVFGCLLFILLGHTAAQKYRSTAFFPRFSHIPDTTPFRVSLPRDRENCILLGYLFYSLAHIHGNKKDLTFQTV